MEADVYAAFRSIDVPEAQAMKAAEALSRRDADVVGLKSDMNLVKALLAVVVTFQIAIFVKLFLP